MQGFGKEMSLRLDLITYDGENKNSLLTDCGEAGWKVTVFDSIEEYLDSTSVLPSPVLIFSIPDNWNETDGDDSLGLLKTWREENTGTQLVLLVPEKWSEGNRLVLDLAARHCLKKPYAGKDLTDILSRIARGLGKRRQKKAIDSRLGATEGFEEIIGVSEKIKSVIALAEKVGKSDFTSVMITGENGTGKGAIAKAVHQASSRASGPFIEVNCAAIPRALLESEFFGYEKGAFTDAKEKKIGLFECANNGTIFLDEVGEIDYGLQAKLLKFLDSRTIRRVSGTQFLPVDVRIISATNRDLRNDIEAKLFRVDLFYRLNVVEINLPPLRDRIEDIRPIAESYTRKFAARLKKKDITLSDEAIELLERYYWPGNIRELINLIERAVLLNTTGQIKPADLPIMRGQKETTLKIEEDQGILRIDLPQNGASLEEVEKGLILASLARTGGNITRAAGLLKVERGALRYKMKKHGIDGSSIKEKTKNGVFEPLLVTE